MKKGVYFSIFLILGLIDDETAAAHGSGVKAKLESVQFADRSGDSHQRMINRTTLADARHQSGVRADALALFREAESMQVKLEPEFSLLYSLRGFQYCDLLLGGAERMAWATTLASNPVATDRPKLEPPLDALPEVEQRAGQTLEWVTPQNWLLDIALDRLTLGRVALYRAILEGSSFLQPAREPLTAAVDASAPRAIKTASTASSTAPGCVSWKAILTARRPTSTRLGRSRRARRDEASYGRHSPLPRPPLPRSRGAGRRRQAHRGDRLPPPRCGARRRPRGVDSSAAFS